MKKLVTLIIGMIYLSISPCFAFSELHYLKNVKTDDISQIVEQKYIEQGFNITNTNPYFGISPNSDDYAVIILQQSGNNMFYYYQSENNTKINRLILKDIRKQNIVCEQSFNANIISIYDSLAEDALNNSGLLKKYTFEEDAFTPPTEQTTSYTQQNTLRGGVVQLSAGTKMQVYLQNAINTSTAAVGDKVIAVLMQDLKYNNTVVAPQGSLVYGTLAKARNASYGSRSGRVVIHFNQIATPDNRLYDISTEEIDFSVANEGKLEESAKNAATSAAVGALVGLLFAALSSEHNYAKGALIGASTAGGVSVVKSVAAKGVDAEIPSFTELEITLKQPLSVSVGY